MRKISAQEFAVCMGWDAFRMAIGASPRNFTRQQVLRWLSLSKAKS